MSKEFTGRLPNAAAVYVRVSTEYREQSRKIQLDAIHEYAKGRGLDIVKQYSDDGKSGLMKGRDSLTQMITDARGGTEVWSNILVYDVSRWWRFPDADESAYYEHTCRRAGVSVHYCAEQVENDRGPGSAIVEGVRPAMAGGPKQEGGS